MDLPQIEKPAAFLAEARLLAMTEGVPMPDAIRIVARDLVEHKAPEVLPAFDATRERIEAATAEARQATSTGGKEPQLSMNSREADKGKASTIAASQVGMSEQTAERAASVVDRIDARTETATKGSSSMTKPHTPHFMTLARCVADTRGISMTDAMREIVRKRPDIHAAWLERQRAHRAAR